MNPTIVETSHSDVVYLQVIVIRRLQSARFCSAVYSQWSKVSS